MLLFEMISGILADCLIKVFLPGVMFSPEKVVSYGVSVRHAGHQLCFKKRERAKTPARSVYLVLSFMRKLGPSMITGSQ